MFYGTSQQGCCTVHEGLRISPVGPRSPYPVLGSREAVDPLLLPTDPAHSQSLGAEYENPERTPYLAEDDALYLAGHG